MQTITMNTSELQGIALDYAVALVEGYSGWDGECFTSYADGYPGAFFLSDWRPSSSWAQAGEIIQRERISLDCDQDTAVWYATYELYGDNDWESCSKSATTAAMRCYVAKRLGKTVGIPVEIANAQQ